MWCSRRPLMLESPQLKDEYRGDPCIAIYTKALAGCKGIGIEIRSPRYRAQFGCRTRRMVRAIAILAVMPEPGKEDAVNLFKKGRGEF